MSEQTVKVNLEENSKYRVAYELMRTIAHLERSSKDREYFLRLYRQCYKAVDGYTDIEQVVNSAQKPMSVSSGVMGYN